MLQELSVVEHRYLAVREVLAGARVTDVATRYGIDRRTVHRWLVRYANEGLGALSDRTSRPDRCPHQIAPEIEARIVELRRAHPGWGPRTILARLRRELTQPPSRSAIYRCLIRHGLIDPKPRRRRLKDFRRWERSRPMELWQMDVMGGVMLTDGTELKRQGVAPDHAKRGVERVLDRIGQMSVQRHRAGAEVPDEGATAQELPDRPRVGRRTCSRSLTVFLWSLRQT